MQAASRPLTRSRRCEKNREVWLTVHQAALPGAGKHPISLSVNSPGIYLLHVTSGNEAGTAKIIRK